VVAAAVPVTAAVEALGDLEPRQGFQLLLVSNTQLPLALAVLEIQIQQLVELVQAAAIQYSALLHLTVVVAVEVLVVV
jgi:hypothetical protein